MKYVTHLFVGQLPLSKLTESQHLPLKPSKTELPNFRTPHLKKKKKSYLSELLQTVSKPFQSSIATYFNAGKFQDFQFWRN